MQRPGKRPSPMLLQAWFINTNEDDPLVGLDGPAQAKQQIKAVVGKRGVQIAETQQAKEQ